MEGCGGSMVKYLMLFINLLFALAGLLLIGVGAHIQINSRAYLDFLSDNYLNTPIFIIITGVIIFVVAFFGCCGAWQENSCMVYTYAALLTVILIGEIAAGIAAFVLKDQLKKIIKEKMTEGMQNYDHPDHEGVTQTWDLVQSSLKCCGVANYTDWTRSTGESRVPDSCCKTPTPRCGTELSSGTINQEGCYAVFRGLFMGNMGIVGGVAVGVGLLQVVGVAFSYWLAGSIRKEGK